MWTSINMDAYLAITCHYIDDSYKMNTVLLDVEKFPNRHTAENMALVKMNVMMEWAITDKVKCLVTDAAANMIACARILQVRHSVCIAHALNTMVKKSFDQVPALCDIRNKAKKVVTYFRSSTSAKEMLTQVQQDMNRPVLKLVNEVETRWNSTFHMLQRQHDERQTVGASLASLKTDIAPLHAQDYEAIQQILCVLAPFHLATVELSEEKRVSGSKVIPLLKMIHHSLQVEQLRLTMPITKELTENLIRRLREHIWNMESLSIMTMATLLDPRFKKLGFLNQTKMTEAVKRLKTECGNVIRAEDERPSTSSSTQGGNLWLLLDSAVDQHKQSSNATSDAIVEVDKYLSETNIQRTQDPLEYWRMQKQVYPHLYTLALQFLCTPASSVPCERVFSKAGEVLSKRRNRLSPKTMKQLLFLNKNN
ncbi:hypothetical protein PO909_002676 [Leuciscus waleckii]